MADALARRKGTLRSQSCVCQRSIPCRTDSVQEDRSIQGTRCVSCRLQSQILLRRRCVHPRPVLVKRVEIVDSSVNLDGKKPRLENQPSLGRNDSVGSQDASPEPALISSVPRRVDHTSFSVHHSHGHSSPGLRYSPTTSLSSPALSGRAEKSNSPSVPPNPRQLPHTSWERDSAKRPEPLPPITSFEPRESPVARGSSAWFDTHLGTTLNNTSPLSNYRRSFHPPALFVQNDSTSSSKSSNSPSQCSDPSDNSIFANGHREEASSRRQPPTPLRGLNTPTMSPTQAADLKPRNPILPQPPGPFSLA